MSLANTLTAPDLLHARDAHITRLQRLFTGATPEQPFYLLGLTGSSPADLYTEPERWVAEALQSLADQSERLRDERVFRPLCLEFNPYGVHFVDRIFGARVWEHAGQWWSECLTTSVGSLRPPDLGTDPTWALARRAAEAYLAHGVTVPYFVLPTIASALNVIVNLYGEAFLVALLADPGAAERDLATINTLLCELHQWYRARFPAEQIQAIAAAGRTQPPDYGQLCGCTTQLLSARQYAQFVAPLDAELLGGYPNGGMIHLCGAHTQHLPVWRKMRQLRAVQVNDRAAEDLEAYFTELRDDQVIYLNPTATMTAQRALEITGGRRLVIVGE